MKKGRPRLAPQVRLHIVQIRASDPENPPSIDRILDRLQEEGVDPLPARATVHNIVREWENIPEEIRWRELPFVWHHLERARIPWEASSWIFQCLRQRYQSTLDETKVASTQASARNIDVGNIHYFTPSFTNRWATWCWRVHLAAPDLLPKDVLTLAVVRAAEERVKDLTGIEVEIQNLSDWFALRPDIEARTGEQGWWKRYWDVVDLGLVANPIPKTMEEAVQRAERSIVSMFMAGAFHTPNSRRGPGHPAPVVLWGVLTGNSPALENVTDITTLEEEP